MSFRFGELSRVRRLVFAVVSLTSCHWVFPHRPAHDRPQTDLPAPRDARPDGPTDTKFPDKAPTDISGVVDTTSDTAGAVDHTAFAVDHTPPADKPPGDKKVVKPAEAGPVSPCKASFANWTVLESSPNSCEAHCPADNYSISCIPGGSCACQSLNGGWWDCSPTGSGNECLQLWMSCCK